MKCFPDNWLRLGALLFALALATAACTSQAKNTEFFGKVQPPRENVLRYISGDEPESLDPQIGTGQPEGRIYMALFEGLAEFDPKTNEAIPEIAERWEVNSDSSEFTFFLRHNARWSNGDPLNAQDFVYTFRRGLSPELAARNAYLAYYIKYGQDYNEGGDFVRDPKTGEFVLEREVALKTAPNSSEALKNSETPNAQSANSVTSAQVVEHPELSKGESLSLDTPFHHFMHAPTRLVVPGAQKDREKAVAANPKLKDALVGKELVPVKAEDIGVEAIDDYTLRITLTQSAPFFIDLMPHQFFKAVPRKVIEKYGDAWTQAANIVTCGPFKLESWKPYNEIVTVRDPMYWDAANVHLDKLIFYSILESTTMMNLYKSGEIEAMGNHDVPVPWIDHVRPLKDYMDAPESATDYYQINVTKPPMNDVRVRKAFNMAIDKVALSEFQRVTKPLTAFTPEGIFPGYPQVKGDDFNPTRAKQLMIEAGFKDDKGNYDPKKFPVREVEISYNVNENNKQVAEFVQAQWKQNLGITVPLKSEEWKTFLDTRSKLEYKGFARSGWIGDYLDPFTFLNLFYTPTGDNGTGWWDPKYVAMLDDANRELDPHKRFELLAKAESYMLDAQPVIPLQTKATNWLKKPYVKGMYPNPQTMIPWKFVYIERDPAKWDRGVPKMTE